MDLGVPLPTVDAALSMRYISAFKKEREMADLVIKDPKPQIGEVRTKFLSKLENALYLGLLLTYTQGFEFLQIASQSWRFNLNLSEVARIWRGGCIIRSALLDDFRLTYKKYPKLSNLLLDNQFSSIVNKNQPDLRQVVIHGAESGIPIMTFMSVLSYLDAYSSGHLAANMIQAQRDYFGSHKYQKVGEEGEFHTDW
jgi:6-phosphogluconate dehydrogenase